MPPASPTISDSALLRPAGPFSLAAISGRRAYLVHDAPPYRAFILDPCSAAVANALKLEEELSVALIKRKMSPITAEAVTQSIELLVDQGIIHLETQTE